LTLRLPVARTRKRLSNPALRFAPEQLLSSSERARSELIRIATGQTTLEDTRADKAEYETQQNEAARTSGGPTVEIVDVFGPIDEEDIEAEIEPHYPAAFMLRADQARQFADEALGARWSAFQSFELLNSPSI
jgi:hypothetical protein